MYSSAGYSIITVHNFDKSNSPSTQTHLYFGGTIHAPNKNNNGGCIYVYAATMKDFRFRQTGTMYNNILL